MPELPEVETIVRALRSGSTATDSVIGREVSRAEILWEKTVAQPGLAGFVQSLAGQHISAIDRRGKFIVMHLDHGALLFHLRMSGDLRVEDAYNSDGKIIPPASHDRLIIFFKDGRKLAFNDARKFGRVWLVDDPEMVTGKLGPEPLGDDFTPDYLVYHLGRKRRQLKPLLLDQEFIAGLGNIYTDEALHTAKLHPLRLSHEVTPDHAYRLWEAIREVLEEGIRRNGASIDWVYRGGGYQNHFRVYQRKGMPCRVCGNTIHRMTVGQRGTYFCPVCQENPVRNSII